MTTSPSRLAYTECFEILDAALADDKGTRIKFEDWGAANHFRMRVHTARRIDRDDNRETYEEGHVMHGRSAYDVIVARIKEAKGATYLYLEKRSLSNMVMENLSEIDGKEEAAPVAITVTPSMQQVGIIGIEQLQRRA